MVLTSESGKQFSASTRSDIVSSAVFLCRPERSGLSDAFREITNPPVLCRPRKFSVGFDTQMSESPSGFLPPGHNRRRRIQS